jgi:hypothetical protein
MLAKRNATMGLVRQIIETDWTGRQSISLIELHTWSSLILPTGSLLWALCSITIHSQCSTVQDCDNVE